MATVTTPVERSTAHRPRATAGERPRPPRRVVTCYDMLDLANRATGGGIQDFTDGMYLGDPTTSYAQAQQNQADWLLDQVGCRVGSRLLDIGCGNGTLLQRARQRGASAHGITISPAQIARCRDKGLDVRLCGYERMGAAYTSAFDCLVANGSIEHFVQADQAAAERAEDVYRRMFAIFRRVLDPSSHAARLATTVIHFGRVRIDPREMVHGPLHFVWGSDAFHYALLVHSFGGFYPVPGQLEACAKPYFRLVGETDGTDDYRMTSEHWLAMLKRSVRRSPRFQAGMVGNLLRHPLQTPRMLTCLLIAQSWNWQFRGQDPPMRLLRQTWEAT